MILPAIWPPLQIRLAVSPFPDTDCPPCKCSVPSGNFPPSTVFVQWYWVTIHYTAGIFPLLPNVVFLNNWSLMIGSASPSTSSSTLQQFVCVVDLLLVLIIGLYMSLLWQSDSEKRRACNIQLQAATMSTLDNYWLPDRILGRSPNLSHVICLRGEGYNPTYTFTDRWRTIRLNWHFGSEINDLAY